MISGKKLKRYSSAKPNKKLRKDLSRKSLKK